MIGAIIGDIIGSIYEFSAGRILRPDEFFKESSRFTDDSVMTLAVGEALIDAGPKANADKIKKYAIKYMQKYGKKYPDAGYGGQFSQWLKDKHCAPYNSFGNGSAMRVSAAGWLYGSLEKTREVAAATAAISHSHPEGIKGAEAVASVIYLARTGKNKEELAKYVENEFGYDVRRDPELIRKTYKANVTCQGTVPEAIIAFLSGETFEDVIRIAVSFGGDTDTLTAIAGSMAEAYFDIPEWIQEEACRRLDKNQKAVLKKFNKKRFKRNI